VILRAVRHVKTAYTDGHVLWGVRFALRIARPISLPASLPPITPSHHPSWVLASSFTFSSKKVSIRLLHCSQKPYSSCP